jgi:predicted DCC family thiol-disulfide oxidoreductase YuxK
MTTENKILFTDISAPEYDPKQHGYVSFEEGMTKLRAVLPDGRVVSGVEVFRQVYDAIGLGWIFAVTKLPVVGVLADFIYDLWAENRLKVTGRQDLVSELKERASKASSSKKVVVDEDCSKCSM